MRDFENTADNNLLTQNNGEMWIYKKSEKGDHIRVVRMGGLFAHHGIYVSDEEVIHFTLDDNDNILNAAGIDISVIVSSLESFLKGGILEVKVYTEDELKRLRPVKEIVEYARNCVGRRGYDLGLNNCEHFANECTLGEHISRQVERAEEIEVDLNYKLTMALEDVTEIIEDRIENAVNDVLDILIP